MSAEGADESTISVPTERRRATTPVDQAMTIADWTSIKSSTNFPDDVILHWYELFKAKCPDDQVTMPMGEIERLLRGVYAGKTEIILSEFWEFSNGGTDSLKFRRFIKAVSNVSDHTNLEDIKLDLTTLMCCDISEKRGRVDKKSLATMLKNAGHLTLRQSQRVEEDIKGIFESLKEHVSADGSIDPVHFRKGVKASHEKITDPVIADAKYNVSTCVPELRTAILAIANFAIYPVDVTEIAAAK